MKNNIKVIAVTSSSFGEGKSTISSNLSIGFCEKYKKTLLIDCNIHSPKIASMFMIPNKCGLTNLLIGSENNLDKIVTRSKINNLDIITSGKKIKYMSEYITSKRMGLLIEKARIFYDVIILDCPALLQYSDTKILSSNSDGTIVVCREGYSRKEEMKQCIKILDQINVNILGFINNYTKNIKKQYF